MDYGVIECRGYRTYSPETMSSPESDTSEESTKFEDIPLFLSLNPSSTRDGIRSAPMQLVSPTYSPIVENARLSPRQNLLSPDSSSSPEYRHIRSSSPPELSSPESSSSEEYRESAASSPSELSSLGSRSSDDDQSTKSTPPQEYISLHSETSEDSSQSSPSQQLLSGDVKNDAADHLSREETMVAFKVFSDYPPEASNVINIAFQVLELSAPKPLAAYLDAVAQDEAAGISIEGVYRVPLDIFTILMHHAHTVFTPWQQDGFSVTQEMDRHTAPLMATAWELAKIYNIELLMDVLKKKIEDKVWDFERREETLFKAATRSREYMDFINTLDRSHMSDGCDIEELRMIVVDIKAENERRFRTEGLTVEDDWPRESEEWPALVVERDDCESEAEDEASEKWEDMEIDG